MSGKNQVASSPLTPYIRDRSTHVAEVMAHSGRIAEHLGLNAHLSLAIAAGHDIGHVPLGHQGEHYLVGRMGKPFSHEVMGVVVAQHIERRGEGLNLTHETLDGMYRHSGSNASPTMTPEAWVVRYSDKIAYLFADFNDFRRLRWKCSTELVEAMDWFGRNQRDRTFRTMVALCEESTATGKVSFDSSEPAKKFDALRKLMYREYARVAEQNAARILDPIYDFLERSSLVPPHIGIALLTDSEVRHLVGSTGMLNSKSIMDTGLGEIIETYPGLASVDVLSLDLDW
jgi:dGTPase